MAEFPTSFLHDDQDVYLAPRYHEDESDDEGNVPCRNYDDFDDMFFANPETCYASTYGNCTPCGKWYLQDCLFLVSADTGPGVDPATMRDTVAAVAAARGSDDPGFGTSVKSGALIVHASCALCAHKNLACDALAVRRKDRSTEVVTTSLRAAKTPTAAPKTKVHGVTLRMSFSLAQLAVVLIAVMSIWWLSSSFGLESARWSGGKSSSEEGERCYSIVLLNEAHLDPLTHLVLDLNRMQTDPHQMAAYKDREAVVGAGRALVGLYKAHAAGQIITDVGAFSTPDAGAEDPFVELQKVVKQ